MLARFANERQALAMMDHPNIARIFDAGATPKGPALLRHGVHRGRTHHAVLRRQADDHRRNGWNSFSRCAAPFSTRIRKA